MQGSGLQYLCLGLLLAVLGGVFYHGLYFLLKTYLVRRVCGPLLKRRKDLYSRQNGGGEHLARSLSDGDVAEISVKVVSQVVASLSCAVSVVVLWQTRHDVLFSRCWILRPYVCLIAWYFVYDLYAMFEAYCLRKNLSGRGLLTRTRKFVRKKWPFVLHHVVILVVGVPLIIGTHFRRRLGDFYIGTFIVREFSNPFTLTANILKLLDFHESVLYKVNGALLIVIFFIVRILNSPLSFLAYAVQYHAWDVVAAAMAMRPVCHIMLILEYCLQVYWFTAIVKLALNEVKHHKSD